MTRLGPCPLCDDEGPWENAAARAAHIRAHHTADCDVCGMQVNASGLPAHMRVYHPDGQADAQPAAPAEPVDQDPEPDPPAPAPEPAAPVPDVEQVDALTCPDCGGGPYADRRGLAAHRRSHQNITCDECGKTVKAHGIGPHMRGHRPTQVECPDCGKLLGPAGLGAHRAAHRRAAERAAAAPPPQAPPPPEPARPRVDRDAEIECPDCGIQVKARGLGNHRAGHRRILERNAPPAPRRTLPEALAAMLPDNPDVADRITEFLEQAKEPPGPGLWVVAPLNGTRPWLCRTAAVGHVASRHHTASVVLSVDDIAAELDRPHLKVVS